MNGSDTQKTNVRAVALDALLLINKDKCLSHLVMREAFDKYAYLSRQDRAFLHRLVYGTLENQIRIDHAIGLYSSVKLNKIKPYVLNLIRMSVYQIMYLDKVPDSAAVNEAVGLIRHSSFRNLSGFVNAVLRNIARNKDGITYPDKYTELSIPEWMYRTIAESIGEESADAYLDNALSEHRVWIRKSGKVNRDLSDMEAVDNADEIIRSEAFLSGKVTVQDLSATIPLRLSDIKAGDTVIDVCSAPGGKAIQAAETAGSDGHVYACDLTEKKVSLIKENAARMKADNIDAVTADALVYKPEYDSIADIVIADLPCSGLGTLRRKPDIKNRLNESDIDSLIHLQKAILKNVCRYVKTGGELIYSTCTLDRRENEGNVTAFLEEHPEFAAVDISGRLPERFRSDSMTAGYLTVGPEESDGFFAAVLIRVK